jgi:hypothetical protein
MAIKVNFIVLLGHPAGTYISTLGAKEMSGMPLSTASNNDLTFDRRLAALASWTEELVEIQVAIEPQ